MTTILLTVVVASLVGSLHCAGMCGAFVAFAVGAQDQSRRGHLQLQLAYHGGRLVTYGLLGAMGGLLGAALDLGGSMVGLQKVAGVLAGSMMIFFGIVAVLRMRGVRLARLKLPKSFERAYIGAQRRAMAQTPPVRALLTGLLTTLLPCGWLYAFVIVAASTGHPLRGAMVMVAFWMGTVPVLAGLGMGVQQVTGVLRRRAPALTACAFVVLGLVTIVQRLNTPAIAATSIFSEVPTTAEDAAAAVNTLDSGEMPCCHAAETE